MQIIRNNDTKVVAYAFRDDQAVFLTGTGLNAPGLSREDITTETHSLVTDVDGPPVFIGGAMRYDTAGWTIVDEDKYNAAARTISDSARQEAKQQVRDWIQNYIEEHFTKDYPKEEIASWVAKAAAARAYNKGEADEIQTLMLQEEAAIKGQDVGVLVASIIAKAGLYEVVISRVAGLRSVTSKRIDAALPSEIDSVLADAIATAEGMAAQLGV